LGACVTAFSMNAGVDAVTATVLGTLAGAAAGYLTGFLSTAARVPQVIAGILVWTSSYSACLVLMGKPNDTVTADQTLFAGLTILNHLFKPNTVGSLIVEPLVLFVFCYTTKKIIDLYLKSEAGIAMRAVGDNPAMASAHGVNANRAIRRGLALANGLVGFSGALFCQRERFADVNMGFGMLIVGLAAVFVGDAFDAWFGKGLHIARSTAFVFAGALVHRIAMASAFEFGLPSQWHNALTAGIVLVVLMVPSIRNKITRLLVRGA